MTILVGICGGSGSGKTTTARIFKELAPFSVHIIEQDSYYRDQSGNFDFDGGSINFDHPSSIDFPLLSTHLQSLKNNRPVQVPRYDFASHKRLPQFDKVPPSSIVILDGILVFSQKEILEKLDYKIFIDIEEDLRFQRRLRRDTAERGRTEEGIRRQFYSQVAPMHNKYVLPSKEHADWVISHNDQTEKVITEVLQTISEQERPTA